MKTDSEVEALERLIGQLNGLHAEISQLAKKSPNDALNAFKLKLVNKVIAAGNAVLPKGYRPFEDFEQFDSDDMPTNSDVTIILTQYMEQSERYRSDNVMYEDYKWFYKVNGRASDIIAAQPTKVGEK
jgi:hypothetical protein